MTLLVNWHIYTRITTFGYLLHHQNVFLLAPLPLCTCLRFCYTCLYPILLIIWLSISALLLFPGFFASTFCFSVTQWFVFQAALAPGRFGFSEANYLNVVVNFYVNPYYNSESQVCKNKSRIVFWWRHLMDFVFFSLPLVVPARQRMGTSTLQAHFLNLFAKKC